MEGWMTWRVSVFTKARCPGRSPFSGQGQGVYSMDRDPTATLPWPFSPQWPEGREIRTELELRWGNGSPSLALAGDRKSVV